MKDDAIDDQLDQDVSADEQQTAGDTPPEERAGEPREMTERERRMAELVKERYEHEGIDYEPASEGEPEEGEQDAATQDEGGDDPAEEAAETDDLQALGYYRKPDGKLYTTVKVNGEEREVLADQVKAYLQKDLAGDWKLQQAADRERRLQEMERQLKEREAQIQQSLSKQPPSGMDADSARQQAKAVLQKIWDGDDDAAAEALTEFLQKTSAGQNPDELLREAERRAMTAMERREAERQQQEWQSSVAEGNRWLQTQHPDIYRDQKLFNLVNGETERMVLAQQAGDPDYANLSPRDIIARAADEVQQWMDGRKEQPQRTASRQQRKDGLTPMPRGLSKQPSQKPKHDVDTSPAAVIARMREARAVN